MEIKLQTANHMNRASTALLITIEDFITHRDSISLSISQVSMAEFLDDRLRQAAAAIAAETLTYRLFKGCAFYGR